MIYLHLNRKERLACNFNFLSKLKDFSRSQAVRYTVHVVMFRRQCKIRSLLLQTT